MGKKTVFGVLIVILAIYFRAKLSKIEGPTIQTPSGKVKGILSLSREGNQFLEFLKIPYAKPPIGKLRFQSPVPYGKWDEEVLDGTEEGPICTQIDLMTKLKKGEENCLFLNVFVPKNHFEEASKNDPIPVIAFFHGGYFAFGSGNAYRPDFFMDERVIIVTVNYRLGVLGFLNTGDGKVSGNMGMKDQTLALKWIQKNIKSFNGDPKRVSILGESAGSASVHYHVLSPMSKNLFSKAISQSGTATCEWAFQTKPKEQAERFARNLNCSTNTVDEMLGCFMKLEAHDLVEGSRESLDPLRDPITIFVPTVDSGNKGPEDTFLPGNPYTLLEKGEFNQVPWYSGVNSDEGLLQFVMFEKDPSILARTAGEGWKDLAERALFLTDHTDEHLNLCKEYYFGKDNMDSFDRKDNYNILFSTRTFYTELHNSAKAQSKHSLVYLYYYSYKGEYSLYSVLKSIRGKTHPLLEVAMAKLSSWIDKYIMGNEPPKFPPCHSDELSLIFYIPWLFQVKTTDRDYKKSKEVVQLWIQIATKNEKVVKFRETNWPPVDPFSKGPLKYFEISDTGYGMIDEPFEKSVEFWNKIGISSRRYSLKDKVKKIEASSSSTTTNSNNNTNKDKDDKSNKDKIEKSNKKPQ